MEHFRDLALGQAPRILGLGDRQKGSATFGCFDRAYWHYRFLDFPNARFQEAVLLLALLWHENFPGNIYFANKKILEWADAAIHFWFKSRNRDGSVAEAYPFERSFCATCFTTFAITESLLLLDRRAPASLEITANWLARNNSPAVANQMAVAAIALDNCYRLTGVEQYRTAAQAKIETLLKSQDAAGYFPEYGGYDVGYSSITLSCLAHYQRKTRAANLLPAMQHAARFLEARVREDGTYSIEGTSRQTQFLYPYGLVVLRSDVARRLTNGLRANRVISPAWLDDRYIIQLTTDYLLAYLELYHADDYRQVDRVAVV